MGIIKKLTHMAKHDQEGAQAVAEQLDYLFFCLADTSTVTNPEEWTKNLISSFTKQYLIVEKIQQYLVTIDDHGERISHAYAFECYFKKIGLLDTELQYDELLMAGKYEFIEIKEPDNGQESEQLQEPTESTPAENKKS